MGNEVIVVAGATHRAGLLDEYEAQLAAAGIDFHLEPLSNLPAGANSINMGRRITYIRSIATKFPDYDRIVMTDAWDVLFYGSKRELLVKLGSGPEISAERNCYPEPHLAPRILATYQCEPLPWVFANNGLLHGHPEELLRFCERAESLGDLQVLDQAWFNRRLAENTGIFGLDTLTDIYYVVSATQEDGALQMKDGRPWNSRCDSFPCFFHFSGQCPVDGFRDLLAGRREAL